MDLFFFTPFNGSLDVLEIIYYIGVGFLLVYTFIEAYSFINLLKVDKKIQLYLSSIITSQVIWFIIIAGEHFERSFAVILIIFRYFLTMIIYMFISKRRSLESCVVFSIIQPLASIVIFILYIIVIFFWFS